MQDNLGATRMHGGRGSKKDESAMPDVRGYRLCQASCTVWSACVYQVNKSEVQVHSV